MAYKNMKKNKSLTKEQHQKAKHKSILKMTEAERFDYYENIFKRKLSKRR